MLLDLFKSTYLKYQMVENVPLLPNYNIQIVEMFTRVRARDRMSTEQLNH